MKVLQIIQKRQLRGAEMFACQLSQELCALGVETDVVYLFDSVSSLPEFKLVFIPLHASSRSRIFDVGAFRRLANIIKDGKYDIVQANASDSLKYAAFSKVIFKWKAKLVLRNAGLMSSYMRNVVHRIFNRWLLDQCDYFISVSENSRRDLTTLSRRIDHRSTVVTIGTYDFGDVEAITKDTVGSEPVIINIGSFVPEKNHVFLVDTFAAFYRRTGKGFLWLVGGGRLEAQIRKKVDELGLEERVLFWGYQKNPIAIMKASSVMVMPSLAEGIPGVILEALSCGIPVIASSAGGIPEIIQNKLNGFTINDYSTDAYLEAILKIIEDGSLRTTIVAEGKRTIHDRFMMKRIGGMFNSVYETLTSSGKKLK